MGYTHGWLDGNKRYHVVTGDCLWNIALDYMGAGNRYPEIKQANGLSSNVIYPNQVFIIPGVTPGYGGAPAPAPPVTEATATAVATVATIEPISAFSFIK